MVGSGRWKFCVKMPGFTGIRDSGERLDLGEEIEVNAVGMDKYTKLNELAKRTHKDKPRAEDLAELRQCRT